MNSVDLTLVAGRTGRTGRTRGERREWLWVFQHAAALVIATALAAPVSGGANASRRDLGDMPWLDKPMRRFAPLLTLPTCEIQPVFGNVVKQARVRTALESWSPMSLSVDPPRMDIRADPATPRRVLSQLVTQWSKTRPIAVTQTAGFLCLAEKVLVDQGNWPLNARNVPGFRVDGVSFESLCERLGEAIQAAHDAERGEAPRWVVTVGDHGAWGAFNPSGPYLNEPITTEIKGGTARAAICQVAMLQPNCFWAA